MKIETLANPSPAELATLSQGIQSYNRQTVTGMEEVSDELKFVVLARDDDAVVGGLRANAFWGYLCIELLWLSKPARGQGMGRQLVRQAEAFALQRGFRHARVETTSFQAGPFYERLGYEVFGELEDFPPGHRSYYMKAKLDPDASGDGVTTSLSAAPIDTPRSDW